MKKRVTLWVALAFVLTAFLVWHNSPDRRMEAWLEQVASGDPNVLAQGLAEFASADRRAVPFLIRKLQTKDSRYRGELDIILGNLPSPIHQRLRKERAEIIRAASALALARIGVSASNAIPNLVLALQDRSSNVRINSVQALATIGPDSPLHRTAALALVSKLSDVKRDIVGVIEAYRQLGNFRLDADVTLPLVKNALESQHIVEARLWALESLRSFGPDVPIDLPLVGGCLTNWHANVRMAALKLLEERASHKQSGALELLEGHYDSDPAIRAECERIVQELQGR